MKKQSIIHGGRGTGRPLDRFKYGKRTCLLVDSFSNKSRADKLADKFEGDGILAVVKKWYSRWCIYRCGPRIRGFGR